MEDIERNVRQSSAVDMTLAGFIASADFKAEVGKVLGSNPIASQLPQNDAINYMAKIRALFHNVDEYRIDLALCIWGILNGVGGLDDYVNKPPVVVASVSVPAYKIFGEIVPVGSAGIPRKLFSTVFEQYVVDILKSDVKLCNLLQPRMAKAGLKPGMELQLVDFVRGTTANTVGMASERNRAKTNLLRQKNATGRIPGDETVPLAVQQVQRGESFDPHPVSNLY